MQNDSVFLLTLGGILLLGLLTDILGQRTILPRVTLLLIFGILIGDSGLGLLPEEFTGYFGTITNIALLMIGFLLGGRLNADFFKQSVKLSLWISIAAAFGAVVFVAAGLMLLGLPLEIAILLGCMASASAPEATVDMIVEARYKSTFSTLLLAVIALDDAWGLIIFSLGLAVVGALNGVAAEHSPLLIAATDIFGAVFLGVALGIPAAYLTGRIKRGQPMLMEALGVVFLCGGLALWFEVSFLIAAMTLGCVIANLAKHHERPFHEIEGIEWPFMAIFFVLAGAAFELSTIFSAAITLLAYCLLRTAGKFAGSWFGCISGGADELTQRWMGPALLPQAGVALGMALVASSTFPEYRQLLLSIIIGSTIIFEIVGPVIARIALQKAEQR